MHYNKQKYLLEKIFCFPVIKYIYFLNLQLLGDHDGDLNI